MYIRTFFFSVGLGGRLGRYCSFFVEVGWLASVGLRLCGRGVLVNISVSLSILYRFRSLCFLSVCLSLCLLVVPPHPIRHMTTAVHEIKCISPIEYTPWTRGLTIRALL